MAASKGEIHDTIKLLSAGLIAATMLQHPPWLASTSQKEPMRALAHQPYADVMSALIAPRVAALPAAPNTTRWHFAISR